VLKEKHCTGFDLSVCPGKELGRPRRPPRALRRHSRTEELHDEPFLLRRAGAVKRMRHCYSPRREHRRQKLQTVPSQ